MLWANSHRNAYLFIVFLRLAALLTAVFISTSAQLLTAGVLLLSAVVVVLLIAEHGCWRGYFVRPLAGSMVLYATVSEIRLLAHSLR